MVLLLIICMPPWIIKYQPARLKDVAGNSDAIRKIEEWFKTWKPGKKPLLLVGPPGVGKTTAAIALAKEHGLELLEMNASDVRDKKNIQRVAGLASEYGSLFARGRLILLDEVDGMSSVDRGGVSAIIEVIKNSRYPIILTANDDYATPVRALLPYVEVVRFRKVNPLTIKAVLKRILDKEGIEVPDEVLDAVVKNASGNLKSAINDLEALVEGEKKVSKKVAEILAPRDREQDIFQALKIIFKTENFKTARAAVFNLDVDPDMLKAWIEENIPNEYEKPVEVAKAYYWLSRADIFSGRIIRRQNWSLLSYAMDLMTAGVALSKDQMYRKFTKYQFPQTIKYLSRTRQVRQIRYSLAKKIGKKMHASPDEVITVHLPYIREMIATGKVDLEKFARHYDLDQEEIAYLRD